ncbi:MAG: glycosyltransferase, partial [Abitibacteriaceae bacterium]|nr:glycosyltransferase [Abditibacteriaceae bacterium]
MPTDLISIIILNHNTWEECTQRCLECVLQNTRPPFEIILVDNGSNQHEAARIQQELQHEAAMHLIAARENLGFSAGNNCGLAEADAEARFICFLNSDCYILEAGWNRKVTDMFERNPQLGAASLTRGEKCHYIDGEYGDAYWFEPTIEPYDCEWVNGACLVVDRSRVGDLRFDTAYSPAYWEDTDLSFQIRQQGWMVAQRPDFDITHLGSSTVAGMKDGIPFQGQTLALSYL